MEVWYSSHNQKIPIKSHTDASSLAIGLNLDLMLHLYPYVVFESSEGSCEPGVPSLLNIVVSAKTSRNGSIIFQHN